MITGETEIIEMRVLDDGLVQARRKDRREMTPGDWREAYRLAGIDARVTATRAMAIFPGAKIVAETKPRFCRRCSVNHVPAWRRGGKIVERAWPDGRREWACSYCGRQSEAGGKTGGRKQE
jgi:hypothetical protein